MNQMETSPGRVVGFGRVFGDWRMRSGSTKSTNIHQGGL